MLQVTGHAGGVPKANLERGRSVEFPSEGNIELNIQFWSTKTIILSRIMMYCIQIMVIFCDDNSELKEAASCIIDIKYEFPNRHLHISGLFTFRYPTPVE